MKEWGLIFGAEMVLAFLRPRGAKTQTRRTVRRNNSLVDGKLASKGLWERLDFEHAVRATGGEDLLVPDPEWPHLRVVSPRYEVGDVVWVREAHLDWSKKLWSSSGGVVFKADGEDIGCHCWSSPIFMQREDSRIVRKIGRVRVERVASISGADAQAEGATIERRRGELIADQYRAAFKALWLRIHGKDAWARNEWVWVLNLKKTKA